MEFSWQEYWSRLPFPFSGDLPIQRSNSDLLHCRWILDRLSHQGNKSHCGGETKNAGKDPEREKKRKKLNLLPPWKRIDLFFCCVQLALYWDRMNLNLGL